MTRFSTESARQSLQSAKERLAALALNADALELARQVNVVARWEGALEACSLVEGMARAGCSREEIVAATLDVIAGGADDGWSGRVNDARRSRFDGFLDKVKRVQSAQLPAAAVEV